MNKFQKIMTIISSIFLSSLGIVLLIFHKELDIDLLEASLFFLIFVELGNFKQFQLEVTNDN